MPQMNTPYPPVEEVIHGVTVKDPYRWLEDRSLPETEEWLQDQKRRCDEYFAACPDVDRIRERVREYLDVEVMDQPARIGEKLFFRRRAKGQEQGCIYVRENGVDRLLVNPSPEGIFISVGIHRISRDGRLLAYERKEGGEDTKSIHIIDVDTGQRFSVHLERGFARGFVFTPDHRGFYYCHETPNATGDHEIRLRRFDESVEDQVVFRAARSRGSRLVLTADDVDIGATVFRNEGDELFADLWLARQCQPCEWTHIAERRKLPFRPILQGGRIFVVIQNEEDKEMFVQLDQRGRVIRSLITTESGMLRNLVVGAFIYVLYYRDLRFSLHVRTPDGIELASVAFPRLTTVRLLPNLGDGESLFVTTESFVTPITVHEYRRNVQGTFCLGQHDVDIDEEPSVHARQEKVASNDGAMLPLVLVSRTPQEGSSIILTSYGGFGVPATPQFSVFVSVLLDLGVTFALAGVRGGGELGKEWHEAGCGRNKQTSIDDFIAVADLLCHEKLDTRSGLAIFGGSNAGLLVAAAMTKRPDLFRVVFCMAPLLDMVRYELFDDAWKWHREYGSTRNLTDFGVLYGYSPYHRVQEDINYPAILFVSGDRDTRCNPAHARKMTAMLQNRDAQSGAVLLDYQEERGHSPVLPLSVRIDALTRRIAFISRELTIPSYTGNHDGNLDD